MPAGGLLVKLLVRVNPAKLQKQSTAKKQKL